MIISVVTIFPEMFESVLRASVLGKAISQGALTVHFENPRDFTEDKHRSVDDTPYGGGAGMVMRPGPLVAALERCTEARGAGRKVALCPTGAPLTQAVVRRLSLEKHLVLLCGRYEGFDERVRSFVDEELSLGDFVLTGGELAAMALIDAVARCLPGVLGNADSAVTESFEGGLLEYPQYTRPPVFRGLSVPEVLVSGDHAKIRRWRRRESLRRTLERRPDLLERAALSAEDRRILAELKKT